MWWAGTNASLAVLVVDSEVGHEKPVIDLCLRILDGPDSLAGAVHS